MERGEHMTEVVAALIWQGERFMICQRPAHKARGMLWEFVGGKVEPGESKEQALVRECREETGYTVRPVRFAALCEEICDDPLMREQYPVYAHKMLHIFLCELASPERQEPTEVDDFQLSCQWVEAERLGEITVLPAPLGKHLKEILDGAPPLFLGSDHLAHNHA